MPFTGDLEHLPIADTIQLVHTTRKSGIFTVQGPRGESNLVFSSGYIVGANHLNNSIRIGSVLVRTGAITVDDLKQALSLLKNASQVHRPLIATLMRMGKLKHEDAQRSLRKLVEITIMEMISWTEGTFTFDTDAVIVPSGDDEQEVAVEAQMALMEALRIFDERERDRANGKEVPAFEELYADVLPPEDAGEAQHEQTAITADILGLADLDQLDRKIPRPASEMEVFDPTEIHRQNIKELLPGFSEQEQESFVSFLRTSVDRKTLPEAAALQAGKAVILFSDDRLIRHAIMTLCSEEGIPVFAADNETGLEGIVTQCLSAMRTPMIVFDSPEHSGSALLWERTIGLRNSMRKKYPAIPLVQLAPSQDSGFILQSYQDGIRAVLPKPGKAPKRESYVRDTIQFLTAFTAYIKAFQSQPQETRHVKELKKDVKTLREIAAPSDIALAMLSAVAGSFERAITFIVRPNELIGERAIGLTSERSLGPTSAEKLKISLGKPSAFLDVREKGTAFFGESSDEALKDLYQAIGEPLSPAVVLLPLISERKVVAIVYGDFGKKEASPVQLDILEILAQQVGTVLEYALFKRQAAKTAQKT
jgi:DNA-binding NarL/FixJ family response regulator